MGMVYVIRDGGRTDAMARLHCKNEERELQEILEKNHDLLPGDQINPEDPRRWLLVKREMPVPDPNTGLGRWSIDFLFVDQDAMPTFVECKRFASTQSRREVVGQMLEYAANGYYYWNRDTLRDSADETALNAGTTLEKSLAALRPADDLSDDEFFDRMEQNLREAQLRLIFLLDEAPMELRSVVDFLNRQMERTEVLLVEARQYASAEVKIVVPTLFGYTEEARMVKRVVSVTGGSGAASRRHWDRDSYLEDVGQRLLPDQVEAVTSLLDHSLSLGCQVTWGTGLRRGSFNVKERSACPRSLITCYSDGCLSFNLAWLNGSEAAEKTEQRLRELVTERMGLALTTAFPTFTINGWGPKANVLTGLLEDLVAECRELAAGAKS